jgi:hypothetical protein
LELEDRGVEVAEFFDAGEDLIEREAVGSSFARSE